MYCVGLDIGNGFVKCFSYDKSLSFPSLFIKNNQSKWDGDDGGDTHKKSKNIVGYDAANAANNLGARSIRPCISGDVLDPQGYKEFVLKALGHVQKNIPLSEIHVVVGLPFSAKHLKKKTFDYFTRFGVGKCTVLPQAFGTLCEYGGTGSTINIGHGTVEFLACKNYKVISGQSLNSGIMNILRGIDESDAGYIKRDFSKGLDPKKVKTALTDTASYIVNKYHQFMMGIPSERLVVSGGGVMFPGMESELRSSGLPDFVVPQLPAMSNARGLFQYGLKMGQ